MFGRTIIRAIAVIALVALVAVIGTSVYNAGVSQGLAEAANAAAASGEPAPVLYPPYIGDRHGWGYGSGFGFFGIIFWIFGLLLVFALLRAAFGGWGRYGGGWSGPGRLAPGRADRRDAPRAASARGSTTGLGRVASAQHGHHPRRRRRAEDHPARSGLSRTGWFLCCDRRGWA